MAQRFQANRFEWKYLIDEPRARGIRDFLRGQLEPDEHARNRSDCSYPVHSLYLDSPTLTLYRQTVQGLKNRFKLRIRFYDDESAHPVFLEIKRRLDGVICKERAALQRAASGQLLQGRWPSPTQFAPLAGNRNDELAWLHFCGLGKKLGAVAAAYVSYVREAYVSPASDKLRVTLDRHIRGGRFEPGLGLAAPGKGVAPRIRGVVLEIKFVDRFPQWLREMVWAFDLQRCSMPKYVHCVEALGLRPRRGFAAGGRSRGKPSNFGGEGPVPEVPWEVGTAGDATCVTEVPAEVKRDSVA